MGGMWITPGTGKLVHIHPHYAPWYLRGGIPASDCVGAYAARGAPSYAASLVNLATPGTLDLIDLVLYKPAWDAVTGWQFNGIDTYLWVNKKVPALQRYSFVIRFGSYSQYLYGFYVSGGPTSYAYLANVKGYGNCFNGTSAQTHSFGSNLTSGATLAITNKVFCNKVEVSPGVVFSATPENVESRAIHIGGTNPASGANYYGSGYIHAFAFYNRVLADSEAIAVSHAMMAL